MKSCRSKTCYQSDGTFDLDHCIALGTPFVILGHCDIYNSLVAKKAKERMKGVKGIEPDFITCPKCKL